MSPRPATLLKNLIPLGALAVAAVVAAPILLDTQAFYPIGYLSPGSLGSLALLVAGWSVPVIGTVGAGRLLLWGLRHRGQTVKLPPIAPLALLVVALITGIQFTDVFGNTFVGSGYRGLIDAMGAAIDLTVLAYAAVGMLLLLHWYILRWRGDDPHPYASTDQVVGPRREIAAAADSVAELPDPARSIALRVREKAGWLLEHDDLLPAGSPDLATTRAILDRHLPATVAAYLRIPRTGTEVPLTADGRTSTQLVQEQLQMQEEALEGVTRRLVDRHARLLVENGDLLQSELGS